jgi:hypothetical protein
VEGKGLTAKRQGSHQGVGLFHHPHLMVLLKRTERFQGPGVPAQRTLE